jgi:hypothetical protein
MANHNINAVTTGASSATQIATDKVRVAATTNIYITSSNSNSVAAGTSDPIVLAGAVERSFYVGAGNYVSVRAVTANGVCSITELGTDGVL